ncbi:MAG: type II secretion system protein [Alphaproteobacteria bacterium]|nr:type II secretion system protein [Alphaproteobacteria bacterium]
MFRPLFTLRRSATKSHRHQQFFGRWRASQGGFSLLEVALALTIITFALTSALPLLQQALQDGRRRTTEARLQQAQTALATYLRRNNRLPCPAAYQSGGGEPLGAEVGSGAQGTAIPNNCGGIGDGLLPFRTLGLAGQGNAQDGWGNWLTYRVTTRLADGNLVAKPISDFCAVRPTNPLTVVDENGISLSGGQIVAFMLISHGENGATSGAIRLDQGRTPAPTASEAENSNDDDTFVARPLSLNPDDPFDDLVVWQTQTNAVSYFGAGTTPICM